MITTQEIKRWRPRCCTPTNFIRIMNIAFRYTIASCFIFTSILKLDSWLQGWLLGKGVPRCPCAASPVHAIHILAHPPPHGTLTGSFSSCINWKIIKDCNVTAIGINRSQLSPRSGYSCCPSSQMVATGCAAGGGADFWLCVLLRRKNWTKFWVWMPVLIQARTSLGKVPKRGPSKLYS